MGWATVLIGVVLFAALALTVIWRLWPPDTLDAEHD
jgi:predicted MFS family arabinose efflux permease